MMRLAPFAAALALTLSPAPAEEAAPAWSRPPPADGHAYPDCWCSNRGARVEMGATACLEVGGERFLARCAMSLNNPVWRRLPEACPPPSPGARLRSGVERVQPG